ncbi:hypothetical protein [Pseudotamlana haliotis]|nr:hypothetical protein [Tamlana haliotis]
MSCDTGDNTSELITDFNESEANWEELKSINGNSYSYQTTFSSWAGFGNMTELKIVDGVVNSRFYEEYEINETNGEKEVINTYLEEGTDLGSHEAGAEILTIDELYNTCLSDYLIVDSKNNVLYFETKLEGIMSLCGYVPEGCGDDCFSGIQINSFNWIE